MYDGSVVVQLWARRTIIAWSFILKARLRLKQRPSKKLKPMKDTLVEWDCPQLLKVKQSINPWIRFFIPEPYKRSIFQIIY